MSDEPKLLLGFEQAPPVLTVEQAARCLASAYYEAPYVEAVRLKVGAKMRLDDEAARFWDMVAESLEFGKKV